MKTLTMTNAALLAAAGVSPSSEPRSGLITAANASRLTEGSFQQPLTDYAVGFAPTSDVASILSFLAPEVPVGDRRFEYAVYGSNDAFVTENDGSDERAIGSAFKRVEYSGAKVVAKTANKGLTYRFDHDSVGRTVDRGQYIERIVRNLTRRLLVAEVLRAKALLAANDNNVSATWLAAGVDNKPKSANPLADLRAAIRRVVDATGVFPNRIGFGRTAAHYFMDLVENKAGGALSGINSIADVGPRLGNMVSRDIEVDYVLKRSATTKEQTFGADLFLFTSMDEPMDDDPSTLKRFTSPTDQGASLAVYVDEKTKHTDITVEHYSLISATVSTGIESVSAANS